MKKPGDYLSDAWTMHHSTFPIEEKARHYKELLAQMRSHYGNALGEDPHTMKCYQHINALIVQIAAARHLA